MKIIKKLFSVEITYALIFFYSYIYFFEGSTTANSFGIAYLLVVLLSLLYPTFREHSFLYALLYPIIFFSGFYNYGVHTLTGVLLGTSISGFLILNYKLVKAKNPRYKNNLHLSSFLLKNIFTIQVLYSFYFYYQQIILDARGQNKLDNWKVVLFTSLLILTLWILQTLIEKISKRTDIVTYANLLILGAMVVSVGFFYTPFLEIGSLNIILPFLTGFMGILLVSVVSYVNSNKKFRFRRTLTTLAYTLIPLIMIIYYPWNISKYLGILFSTLGVLSFNTNYFESKVKQHDLTTRVINLKSFSTNLFLFLGALFTLSAGGLITRLNIADLDYLIMLIAGIFITYLLQDLRETLQERLVKKGLTGAFSVITISLCALAVFLILDTGKLEALGSFLFGIISFIYIKNNFSLRSFTKAIAQKDIGYTYLENILLNLLTVISVSLILIKI